MLQATDARYLNEGTTYVVEIIYPENRIVVDYKNRHDLVLLTSYERDGTEVLRPPEWDRTGFSYVPEVDIMALGATLDLDDLVDCYVKGTEAEGYVVRFDSGLRVKMKFAAYLSLHKILTNCTERTIWEALYNRTDLTKFSENVPDEFDEWVTNTIWHFEHEVQAFMNEVDNYFLTIVQKVGTQNRKLFAQEASRLRPELKSAMFLMLDGKYDGVRGLAYKNCYPSATKPFRQDDE
jgi:RNA ligase